MTPRTRVRPSALVVAIGRGTDRIPTQHCEQHRCSHLSLPSLHVYVYHSTHVFYGESMNLLTLLHARLAPDPVPPFFSCAFEKAVAASSRHHMATRETLRHVA